MIIIDSQKELADYINSNDLDAIGIVPVDADTFEIAHIPYNDLAFVHADIYKMPNKKIQSKLEQFKSVLVFDPEEKVSSLHSNTVLVVNNKTNVHALKNMIMILDDVLREKEVLKSQLISINKELIEAMDNVEQQVHRVKRTYEQKAPRRFEDIKGVKVFSKYAAGENIGGEFFDIFMEQNKLFILMSATTSYLASSSILQFFSQFKSKKDISQQAQVSLISSIKKEIELLNTSKKKSVEIDLFTAVIDLNKHSVSGHLFGNFKILSSLNIIDNKLNANILKDEISTASFDKSFDRGERILLCSPGFVKNWEKLNTDFMIEEMIIDKKLRPLDLLDEIFFQLKKDSSQGFLSYDASAIILEVQENAMVEV